MKNFFERTIDLQLFAEGDGGDNGNANVAAGVADPDAGGQTAENENGQVADVQEEENLDSAFEELIKGKFKEQFDQRTQKTVQARLKNLQNQKEALEKLTPLAQRLSERYGKSADDVDGLIAALDDDDDFYEKKAYELGLTKEQYKEQVKAKREIDGLKSQLEAVKKAKETEEVERRVNEEVKEIKKVYPNFDLQSELENPKFGELLRSGFFNIREAYEIMHKDEVVKLAADTAKKQVASSIASGQSRPVENGLSSQAPSTTKVNIASLTDEQIDEINRRVERGERVSF